MWIIDFIGDLTSFAEREIDKAYVQLADECVLFVLNFSKCEYINSAGIAAVIGLITRTRRKPQHVLACGLSDHYQKLFFMVGLTDYIEICQDESEAIKKAATLPPPSPPTPL